MNQRKKVSLMLVTILVLQIMLPTVSIICETKITAISRAAGEITSGDWKYEVNDDGISITIIEYKGTDEDLIIPSEIDGYTVTAINGKDSHSSGILGEYGGIYYKSSLRTVKLPNTLKTIGYLAFRNCENLYNIEINDELEEIGAMAFEGCTSLKNIKLNNGLKKIGQQAFLNCDALEKIEIPSTVESIVCNWEMNSFRDCKSLTSINVNEGNQNYSSQDGVLFNKDKTILIAYPNAKQEENYSIPQSVIQVYANAFKNPYIKNLSISKYVTKLKGSGQSAFFKGNMLAISECTNLQSIIVDENNDKYSSINGILYNEGQTELLYYPSGKKDTYYIMPETVTRGPNYETSAETVNNQYIEKIKLNRFINDAEFLLNMMNLMYIEVDNGNTKYSQKDGVLYNKEGNRIVYFPMGRTETIYEMDNNVTEIASKAFMNSKLIDTKLSDNISIIEKEAFYNNTRLKNINIPNSITSIGESAFYNCINIEAIVFEEDSKIQSIGRNAFSYCNRLAYISLPEGITSINNIVDECNLKEIIIPSTVTGLSFFDVDYGNNYSYPTIITILSSNPKYSSNSPFSIETNGIPVIRCYQTAEEVKKWNLRGTNGSRGMQYNIINLIEGDERFIYKIEENNEVTITNYIGDNEHLEIPSQIAGYPVTKILYCIGTFKSIQIPSTVKEIECLYSSKLEEIKIDENNEYFACQDGILFNKSQDKLIFYPMGRQETTYEIPEGVKELSSWAFRGNIYIESISIPKSLTQIQKGAIDMYNLSKISVNEGNQNYVSKDNILYKINKYNVEIDTIPVNIEGNIELLYGLKELETGDFMYRHYLESVIVPTTVTNIEQNVFNDCNNLKKLVILPTVTKLAEINAGNIILNVPSDELKIYCEDDSVIKKYARKWGINYEIIEPIKIEIKENPSKLRYLKNEEVLNLEGGLITITYNDGTSVNLDMKSDLIKIAGFDNTTVGKKQIELEYKNCKANFFVNVVEELKELTVITVTTEPNNITYIEGQNFDKTGMVVTATYDDGSTKEVTNYTITDGNNLTAGKASVTISYTENGVTKTTTQEIAVKEKLLTGIIIIKAPTDTNYIAGQNFDKTGMVVTATYDDGSTKEVTDYTVTDGNNLTAGKTSVKISYTENNVTKTTIQNITVTEKLLIEIEEYTESKEGNDTYIENISPNTTIENIINKIDTNGRIETYKGTEKITDINIKIATGMKIIITLNNEHIEYTAVVKGDLTGDGDATLKDILQANKHRLNKISLEKEYFKSGDVTGDGKIDFMDILKINKYRLGKISVL